MPLQQIRVTPADRKGANEKEKAVKYDAKPETFSAGSPTCGGMERRRSSLPSSLSSSLGGGDMCRICHCEADAESPLISPCFCAGSLRYVHQSCLQQWIKSSDTRCCELCKFHFIMHTKIKPFRKWEKLDMSPAEKRKILCSIAFHVVAITCVTWSLYMLIERTAEEMHAGALEWHFWTKLVVLAIEFAGGLVFMYVQCKMYVQLFRRWRAFNRIIYVQNAPEKNPAALFSAEDARVIAGDIGDEKRLSPEEDEFHSCRSSSSDAAADPAATPPPPPPPPLAAAADAAQGLAPAPPVPPPPPLPPLPTDGEEQPWRHNPLFHHPLDEVVVVSDAEDAQQQEMVDHSNHHHLPCAGDNLQEGLATRQVQQTAS